MLLLLVEDNLINQQVASEPLIARLADIDIAENGRLALDYIAREPYELVPADLQMPIMDITATKNCANIFQRRASVIAMMAHAMESDRQKCHAIGMNDYVTKPFIMITVAHSRKMAFSKRDTQTTLRENS